MDITFYDLLGNPIAYTEDEECIYLFSGTPVAYINDTSVYDYNGRHLGRFEEGWIRDNEGCCAFFTEEAAGGPMKPIKGVRPIKGMKGIRPIKDMKEMRPMRPMDSLLWSGLSGIQFFES